MLVMNSKSLMFLSENFIIFKFVNIITNSKDFLWGLPSADFIRKTEPCIFSLLFDFDSSRLRIVNVYGI